MIIKKVGLRTTRHILYSGGCMMSDGRKSKGVLSPLGDGIINKKEILMSGWNVNGIKKVSDRNYLGVFMDQIKPDWLCINQMRVNFEFYQHRLQYLSIPKDYHHYQNCSKNQGVMILTPHKPISIKKDLPIELKKGRGRVITLQYQTFFLVSVQKPSTGFDNSNLKFKVQEFDPAFNSFIVDLKKTKEVIICGDMNLAYQNIDLAEPEKHEGRTSCTEQERRSFQELLSSGFVDSFRCIHPEKQEYTFWSFQGNQDRRNNIGFRFDYILSSSGLKIKEATIHSEVRGSDHCPISSLIQLP